MQDYVLSLGFKLFSNTLCDVITGRVIFPMHTYLFYETFVYSLYATEAKHWLLEYNVVLAKFSLWDGRHLIYIYIYIRLFISVVYWPCFLILNSCIYLSTNSFKIHWFSLFEAMLCYVFLFYILLWRLKNMRFPAKHDCTNANSHRHYLYGLKPSKQVILFYIDQSYNYIWKHKARGPDYILNNWVLSNWVLSNWGLLCNWWIISIQIINGKTSPIYISIVRTLL
jgi:hypothetical protein